MRAIKFAAQSFANVARFNTQMKLANFGATQKRGFSAPKTVYSKTHEWVRTTDNSQIYKIGLTKHACDHLGEIVHIDFPDIGSQLQVNDLIVSVESVKAVGEVYTPLGGKIKTINKQLADDVNLINSDSEGDGWLVEVESTDAQALDNLLDEKAYMEHCKEEDDA